MSSANSASSSTHDDVSRGEVLREVAADVRTTSLIGAFADAAERVAGRPLPDYQALWKWSVEDLDAFWRLVCEQLGVRWHDQPRAYLESAQMPGTEWCPGGTLNYAEHCLQHTGDRTAIVSLSQSREDISLTRDELLEEVERCATGLRALGVGKGSTVAGYVPNIAEAIVAFLATAALGATWASCAPEFGARSVIDRLTQLAPDVLIVIDGYRYGRKQVDRSEEVRAIRAALPDLRHTVLLPYLDPDRAAARIPDALPWATLLAERQPLQVEAVPFAHPLYVLFSSGTTGLPKPIVHGHGGITLEHLKVIALALDLDEDDVYFWFSTTGWMVWNLQVSALLRGAAVVCFDGDLSFPDMSELWRVAEATGATIFGASAPFLIGCRKARLVPKDGHDLSRIRTLLSSGSPLSADGYRWVYDAVGSDLVLNSISGGTDVCSAFVGCSPMQPVRAGELSGRVLGVRVDAFDEQGQVVIGEKGELVITTPMPSMPVGFLGDADGSRYRAAYFDVYPGVWRHGDWITFFADGACVISGRSDATLNRGGVRLGTAEFYAVVDDMPEVADSLVVHLEDGEGGPGRLLLFVVAAVDIDEDALRGLVARELRSRLSPRHVPDELYLVPGVPRTLSGKKLEVPVKRILTGTPADEAASKGALANPEVLDAYVELAASIR
ncbi:acetoacetate--CoA ligase [Paraconexibacter antarcticus]|uniref:Acetoacetate--CoA ligase n=1 Tax=Paraconexibacter antarcticus TaxID=2949664 RepID=A0ABY5DZE7_9ACTN|nr:acetoacetate--CoA ligase [Paraconexibacter antarcticus]UTI66217.1 acetoacetate--CoA ligase [Paraconexibacter antarcticus]